MHSAFTIPTEKPITPPPNFPGMTALLEIKGLSKTFSVKGKRFEALRDVNLSVGDKEFICLLACPQGLAA